MTAVLGAGLVLTACGGGVPRATTATTTTNASSTLAPSTSAAAPAAANTKDVFVVGQSTPISNLNPNSWSAANQVWRRAIFDTLVTLDPDPQPGLASAWKVSPDGKVYTFTLQSGVKYQNGKDFDAQSVVDNLKWAADPQNNVTGGAVLAQATFAAPDPGTVTLTFPTPAPQLLSTLAVVTIWDLTSDLNTAPVGTGPYAVSNFVPNTVLSLARNDNYWDKNNLPKVHQLDIRNYPDNSAANAALASGQIDALAAPPFRDLTTLKKQGMQIVATSAPGNFMLRLNVSRGPLANKLFRQALDAAIDRKSFVNIAGGGVSEPTCSPFPSGSPVYNADVESTCGFDLERAKALLSQSGVATPVTISMDTSDVRQPELAAFAPIMKQDMAKIGIDVEINAIAPALLTQRILSGEYDIQTDWYPWGNVDPALFFITRTWAPGLTWENFNDDTYTQMVSAAQAEINPEARMDAYRKLNAYMIDQAFILPIASRPYIYVARPGVAGFKTDPVGQLDSRQLSAPK
jgi:peptide/nickel transport system substrate-binding protein